MHHTLLLLGLLSACCQPPEDGPLAEGTWGGDPEPDSLTMNADGTGSLNLSCYGGSSEGTVLVADGAVTGTFSFDPDSWGPDTQEEHDPIPVYLEGTVCGEHLEGTATAEDPALGGPWTLDLVLGHDRGFELNCAE